MDTGNVFMIVFFKVCVENDIDRTQNITYPIFHGESRNHFSWRLRSSCGARWLQNEPMAQSRCKWNCLVICDGTDMEPIWNSLHALLHGFGVSCMGILWNTAAMMCLALFDGGSGQGMVFTAACVYCTCQTRS